MKYCFLICKSMNILKVYSVHTIHWDKTEMLKRFPSDKTNDTKKALCFLSRAPTHHSFTFNLWFLYELKHKVCLSETVSGIFIKAYIFVQQNGWILWLSNKTSSQSFAPWPATLKSKQEVSKFNDIWVEAPQKLTWWQIS